MMIRYLNTVLHQKHLLVYKKSKIDQKFIRSIMPYNLYSMVSLSILNNVFDDFRNFINDFF
jgi:hypothetical protein